MRLLVTALVCLAPLVAAQDPATAPSGDPRQRAKAVRDYAKQGGSELIPKLVPYLKDGDLTVRTEAVKAIVAIGGRQTIEPLIEATHDNDSEIQIRVTDGLVNFYLPGYVKAGGFSASLQRAGSAIKSKFNEPTDAIIEPYVDVLPEVIRAIADLVRGAASADGRANAARALGVLRGRAAINTLFEALRSKDTPLIYESLMALQKIRDRSAGARIQFLLRDLEEKVQIAAIETIGLLEYKPAARDIRDVLARTGSARVRRAALGALAMLPTEENRAVYTNYFSDRDDALRASAAEGFGRLKNPADHPMLAKAFDDERKQSPRLSIAFALVSVGERDFSEFGPLRYLVNTVNNKSWRGIARAFLIELCQDSRIRESIYPILNVGTKDEKIQLSQVLAVTGDKGTLQYLQPLASDSDPEVAQEGLRALRTLKARM